MDPPKRSVGHNRNYVSGSKLRNQSLHNLINLGDRAGRLVVRGDVGDQLINVEHTPHFSGPLRVKYPRDDYIISRYEGLNIVILVRRVAGRARAWFKDGENSPVLVL